ncbi:hypothetical protein IC232_04250 [Microvirga sp. BT688]|uniref:hypothetical protein n=1 Tax=Microvirga sp. TaxID=1873136 RepID=UPI0016862923|nr:hypothetical protein [Microvirga sp.]MBD2745905.1 hypothetical protein [Microvirga sp.]
MLTVKFASSLSATLYPSLLTTALPLLGNMRGAVIQKDGEDFAVVQMGAEAITFRGIPAHLFVTEDTFAFDPMVFEAFALEVSGPGETLFQTIGRCVSGFWDARQLHIGDHGIAIFHENDRPEHHGPEFSMTFFSYDQLRKVATQGYGYSDGGIVLRTEFKDFGTAPTEPTKFKDAPKDPEADLMREFYVRVRRLMWEETLMQIQPDLKAFRSQPRLDLAA